MVVIKNNKVNMHEENECIFAIIMIRINVKAILVARHGL